MLYLPRKVLRLYLAKHYPFIESELNRQNLFDTVGERFKSFSI